MGNDTWMKVPIFSVYITVYYVFILLSKGNLKRSTSYSLSDLIQEKVELVTDLLTFNMYHPLS